jgi:signal transduction histidine kinase/CheY-like chemotaxis protein
VRLVRVALAFWVTGALAHVTLGRPYAAGATLVPILGLLLTLASLRRAVAPAEVSRPAIAANALGIFLVCAVTGGTDAPTLLYLPVLAVASGAVLEPRWAGLWLVTTLGLVGALALGEASGLLEVLYPPVAHERTISVVVSSVGTLVVGWRSRQAVTRLADESRERAEAAEHLAKSLAEARAKAEQLVDRRAAYLANVSHELRTPLGAVVGLTRILEPADATAEQRELFQALRTSADSLRMLVDDLLDHEAMDRGMLKVEQGVVRVRPLVSEVCALFEGTASAKGLRLRWEVDEGVPENVRGDALRVRQVLSNLVSNAVKYTSEGSIDVDARMRPGDEAPRWIVEVRDTGPGIDASARALLFLPFERTGSAVARKTTGTGLGLALGRRLAEAMDGTLEVDSEPGRGSTFRLELPCIAETLPDAPRVSSVRTVEPTKALAVLVVDDEPINLRVAALLLERMGHHPRTVATASAALEALRARSFDAVLLDYHMPDTTGPELARAMTSALPAPAPLLIGLTASVSEEVRRSCLEAGMQFVLAKPIDVEQLARVLDRVAERRPTPTSTNVAHDSVAAG